jgi:hypothetical protein
VIAKKNAGVCKEKSEEIYIISTRIIVVLPLARDAAIFGSISL